MYPNFPNPVEGVDNVVIFPPVVPSANHSSVVVSRGTDSIALHATTTLLSAGPDNNSIAIYIPPLSNLTQNSTSPYSRNFTQGPPVRLSGPESGVVGSSALAPLISPPVMSVALLPPAQVSTALTPAQVLRYRVVSETLSYGSFLWKDNMRIILGNCWCTLLDNGVTTMHDLVVALVLSDYRMLGLFARHFHSRVLETLEHGTLSQMAALLARGKDNFRELYGHCRTDSATCVPLTVSQLDVLKRRFARERHIMYRRMRYGVPLKQTSHSAAITVLDNLSRDLNGGPVSTPSAVNLRPLSLAEATRAVCSDECAGLSADACFLAAVSLPPFIHIADEGIVHKLTPIELLTGLIQGGLNMRTQRPFTPTTLLALHTRFGPDMALWQRHDLV